MTGEGPVLGEESLIMTGEGACFGGGVINYDWGGAVLGEESLIMTGEGACFRGGVISYDWGGGLF